MANNTPYAIAKLGEFERAVKQSISEMPALRKRLEKNKDAIPKAKETYKELQNQRRKLMEALNLAALSLMETGQENLADFSMKLSQSIGAFNLMTPDYAKLLGALESFAARLSDARDSTDNPVDAILGNTGLTSESIATASSRTIGRLMNNVKMGYYPTCTVNLSSIARGVSFPVNVPVNLLDPCCGCGIALRSLAEAANEQEAACRTFGVELDGHRAEEALTRIDRVGFGSYYHSRISNEAFHAMLLNPPYLSVITEGGNNTRSEKRFLVDSLDKLMTGGLLIYIIPHYRLTPDIARVLCDNFSDVGAWKFTESEFKKFKQIAVLGLKQKRQNEPDAAAALSSLALRPESIPEVTELRQGRYALPGTPKEVAIFKGAKFNVAELSEQLGKSKSISRLYQKNKLDLAEKRPLLPLSLGQIGLVGGSGLINGLIECGTPHIIKGRIVKEKRVREESVYGAKNELKATTLTETVSNKLIFNLLTPRGFISLTDHATAEAPEPKYPSEPEHPSKPEKNYGREQQTKATENIKNIMSQATGSTAIHKFSPIKGYPAATDGAIALAKESGCFWLLDAIGSYQGDKRLDPAFQVWKLTVNIETGGWKLEGANDIKTVITQTGEYTDFPLEKLTLWVSNGVIMLPSEY